MLSEISGANRAEVPFATYNIGFGEPAVKVPRKIIIDDRGRISDAAGTALRDELQGWSLGAAFTDYTVRNLGFIALATTPHGLRIQMRPAVTSPTAFAALMYWLSDHPHERVILSRLDDDWRHELLGDSTSSKRRLIAVMQQSATHRATDFLRAAVDPRRLRDENPLLALMRLRSEFGRELDFERLSPILNEELRGRYTLISADPDLTTIRIEGVGYGFDTEANYWLGRSVGARVEDGPDRAFGQWVSEGYRTIMKTGLPALDDVDAVVEWPNVGRRRYCYRRLLLPVGTAKGDDRPRLLCATLKNRSISLRRRSG
mgnify:CR=1 FL=1